jgi:hypothetical protein
MKRVSKLSQAAKLELYRVTLVNAKTNELFSIPLNPVCFSPESIEEGHKLYDITRKAFNKCQTSKSKRYEMHKVFHMLKAEFDEKFRLDWKKAQIVFKRDIVAQDKLALSKTFYRTYVKWIELARQFYTELSNNPDLTERLSKRNYSSEETEARLVALSEIELARAAHIFEKGISQNATNAKAEAFVTLNDWMDEFFSFAKIAFRKEPQLMESFGMVVKN